MRKIEFTPRLGIVIFFFLLLIAYSLFQARFIILGPHISVSSPLDGERVSSPIITIRGNTKNIAYISLNDRPIFINEKGNFEEKLIATPGVDIITIRARDRFGRSTEKQISVVYNN
jgi:hypothetical protein